MQRLRCELEHHILMFVIREGSDRGRTINNVSTHIIITFFWCYIKEYRLKRAMNIFSNIIIGHYLVYIEIRQYLVGTMVPKPEQPTTALVLKLK